MDSCGYRDSKRAWAAALKYGRRKTKLERVAEKCDAFLEEIEKAHKNATRSTLRFDRNHIILD